MTKNLNIKIQKATVGNSEGIYLTVNDRSGKKILLERYISLKEIDTYCGYNHTIAFNAPGSEEK